MTRPNSDESSTAEPTNQSRTWTYLLRVLLSFVLAVIVLDFIWSQLNHQDPSNEPEQLWQDALLSSIEHQIRASIADIDKQSRLQNHASPELSEKQHEDLRTGLERQLSEQIGIELSIDTLDQLHLENDKSDISDKSEEGEKSAGLNQTTLILLNDQTYLLATYSDINLQVRIGPIAEQPATDKTWLSSILTFGFYALIAVLVWLWLRPLTTGLDQLTRVTEQFANDHQQPLPKLKLKSPVKELAQSIDSMAERIRTLIQTQSELTSGLSHEIRTPLARIKFALATIHKKVGDQTELDSIAQDVDELEQLIEAMLDYGRFQQSANVLQISELKMDKVAEDIAAKYRWRTGAKISIATDQNIFHADARLIPLALSNLVANATRYATHKIDIGCRKDRQYQIIEVSDDGPGIPEEERENALSPFKKNTGAGASDGFGLGLAIVARIMKLHSGKMQLSESEYGGLKVSLAVPI